MLSSRGTVMVLCVAGAVLAGLPGCGSGASSAVTNTASTNGSDKAIAGSEAGLRKSLLIATIAKLDRRSKACEIPSDRLLADSYGAPDSAGSKAVMTFVFAGGRWLLDDIRSPGAAG